MPKICTQFQNYLSLLEFLSQYGTAQNGAEGLFDWRCRSGLRILWRNCGMRIA